MKFVYVLTILCSLGFGYGLIGTQTPVIINQYFSKYRATASGIALAGGTIGSFLFPPLVKFILFEYSLHGCFLILGGFVLNTLPLAILLRPPIPSSVPVSEVTEVDPEAAAEKALLNNHKPISGDCDIPRVVLQSHRDRDGSLPTTFEVRSQIICTVYIVHIMPHSSLYNPFVC